MSECRGCVKYWQRAPPSSSTSLCPAHRNGFCVICMKRYADSLPPDDPDYEPDFPNRRCEHHMDPEPVKVKKKVPRLQLPVRTAGQKTKEAKRRGINKRLDMSLGCKTITKYLESK